MRSCRLLTFLPITQFTQWRDRAEVTQLLPTNVGPHDYQAKPEDAQKLSQADVGNGLEMEEFLEDLVKNCSPNLKIIDSAKELLRSQLKKLKGMIMTIRKVRNRLKRGTVMIMANSILIWLDPKRAIQQVENIRDGLIAADPRERGLHGERSGVC